MNEYPVLTKEDVKEAMEQVMEVHMLSDHHQFVKQLIDKQQRRDELWQKVKADVATKGILAVVTFAGVIVYTDFIGWIKRILGII